MGKQRPLFEVPTDMTGRLVGSAIRQFVLAGNSTVTVVSEATGVRHTFRFRLAPPRDFVPSSEPTYFVSALTGPDNEKSYSYVGIIRNGTFYHGGFKAKLSSNDPRVIALQWFWTHLDNPAGALVFHEGRCGRCGRKLTVPDSIQSGIGPECATRMGGQS